ncbi:elongation factor P [bacterium]|nr:MAG: elongation factor P [bacterium]
MIAAVDFKKGTKILYKGDPYEVVDFQHSIRGRGRGKVRARLKNLRTGNVLDESFSSEEQFETPDLENADMQFLYADGDNYVFMDSQTYEQFPFPKESVGDAKWFLKEGEIYHIQLWNGAPLSVELPASFVLKVVETEPAVKGDTVSNTTKKAVLETGLEIKVPLFISEDELVKVDTRTLTYISRA